MQLPMEQTYLKLQPDVHLMQQYLQSPQRYPKKDQVSLVGFGTFAVKHRAARAGRNPQTGAEIQIKAAYVPSFKAGKALKDSVNS